MHDTKAHPDPLDVLATEFTARQRQGDCPTIEEYVERYPELAEEIRVLLPTITTLEKVKVRQHRTPDGRVSLSGSRLERLGDFRVIREIGRGGMGIVYEAEQESLGRRVAVKVLPKQTLLDENHLRRFQREAQTAASLHHTNIVPVFGVGQHEGYHYYVMQLIDGTGLDRWGAVGPAHGNELDTKVRRGDTAPEPISPAVSPDNVPSSASPPIVDSAVQHGDARAVARLGIQAAEALEYAHGRGVLHRDVKPANLILDSAGSVWVTDFGLAKVLEQEGVTRTGDVVGTLRYIAPEHLTGVQVDARSDLYGLGITLYELLTGQPAFPDVPQAPLVEKIVAGDIARPRQLNTDIPLDLETIVLKAIACEPKDRYQSAGDLAEDLHRFLDDKPLLARRTTAVEHAWRWCRRNRLTAALIATALSLLILVAASVTVGYVQTKTALDGEKAERERAEAATDVALKVLDDIFEQFAPQRFDPLEALIASGTDPYASGERSLRPALSPDTAALLENMLAFYDRLAEQGDDNNRFRRKAAQANRRIGDIRQHLGQFDEAVAAYGRALDGYRTPGEIDGGADIALEQAQIYNQLGLAYTRTGQTEAGRESRVKAAEILESVLPNNPPAEIRFELAQTYYRLAGADRWDMVPPTGPDGASHGPRDWDAEPPPRSHAPVPHPRPDHPPRDRLPPPHVPDEAPGPPAPHLGQDADHDFSEDNVHQQQAFLRKAVNVLEELADEPSCDPDYVTFLACVYHAQGTLERRAGRPDSALANCRRAVSVLTDLVSRFPGNASYHIVLGWLQQPLANDSREQGELNEARRLLESSRDLLESELAADPDRVYLHGLIGHAYVGLAGVLRELGQDELADQASRQADEHHRQMRHAAPHARGREHDFGRGKPRHPKPGDIPNILGPSGPP